METAEKRMSRTGGTTPGIASNPCRIQVQQRPAVHPLVEQCAQHTNAITVTAREHLKTDVRSDFRRRIAMTRLAASGNGRLMAARDGAL